MRRILIAVTLLFVVLILLISLKPDNPDNIPMLEEAEREFTIGISKDPVAWLAILADKGGMFEKQGLTPIIKLFPSGKIALRAMLNNEVDYSTSAGIPISIAAFERQDFKVLCTLGSGDNEVQIVARKDRGIESPGDLSGRNIATQEASAVHFFLDMFLLQHHLESNVKQTFLRKEDLSKALARGDVDAVSTREPFLSEAARLLGDNVVFFSSPGLYRKASHLTVNKEILNNKPNQVNAILNAMLAARKMLQNEPEKAIQIISTATGVDPKSVGNLLETLDLRPRLNQSILTSLEDGANWAKEMDLVNRDKVPNFLQIIYPQPLAKLQPQSVSIVY